MPDIIQILQSNPGIQRDGTPFNSDCYTDGTWCRFYLKLPRKMGGMVMLTYGFVGLVTPSNGIIRSLSISDGIAKQKQSRFYLGRTDQLSTIDYSQGQAQQLYQEVNVTPPTKSHPKEGYPTGFFQPYPTPLAPSLVNLWSFAAYTTEPGTSQESPYIIAHVAPNANDVANTVSGDSTEGTVNVFYQPQTAVTEQFLPLFVSTPSSVGGTLVYAGPPPLSPSGCLTPPYTQSYVGNALIPDTDPQKKTTPIVGLYPSGGLVVVGAFLFIYGASGVVAWSSPGNPSEFPTDQIDSIAGTKIVLGKNTRGGGTATVLFWSLNSVILGQYSPTSAVINNESVVTHSFAFNTLRDDVSILSAGCVVEYNQNFYWIGSNQFYVYTGVVQQLPNTMSSDWFFNHLNLQQSSKVWGMAIPRYNEIWWYYPRDTATECNAVIIYNVLDNIWYDAVSSRSAGALSRLSPSPYMASSELYTYQGTPGYGLWQHEIGVDQVYLNQSPQAILSSFTTNVFNLGSSGQPDSDKMLLSRRLEPNFAQPFPSSQPDFTNPMSFRVLTRAYANSPVVTSEAYEFTSLTPYIDILIQGGLTQYRFISNIVGGNYQCGKILLTYSPGDVRRG